MNQEIQKCIEILKKGGIILYPTDTVWGIGCDATNESAVKRIFEIKKREDSKSLITLVCNDRMLQQYVYEVPELAWDIIDLSTKPTTIIYPKGKNLASNAIAEDGSIGIRLIKNDFCNNLIYKLNKPIISTSANISGESTPLNFSNISEDIKSNVDYIVSPDLDKGYGKSSSVLKLELNGEIKVLRN